jgi:RNA polymerase sigma-70 factor (ECF subfamily)
MYSMPGYDTFPDDELLKRLRKDDEAAFTEIYNRYWERLVAIGFYFTQNKQSAEDVLHEVMLTLWIRRSELKIESIAAYLGTAVKFAVFKSISREKRRHQLIRGHHISDTESDLEHKLDAKFLEDILHNRIEQLPEKARLVFDYSRNHHLTIAEIAAKMDLSPKAVEYHMTKALRFLRDSFKKIKCFFV